MWLRTDNPSIISLLLSNLALWAFSALMWWWTWSVMDGGDIPVRRSVPVTSLRIFLTALIPLAGAALIVGQVRAKHWQKWPVGARIGVTACVCGILSIFFALVAMGFAIFGIEQLG
jgi:hypothetical protein